jgi:5-methylcytosine-specific restriction endonuclease McrA
MMPIRAENRTRYPADWHEISQRIRDKANNHCEQCGVRNHALIYRGRHGTDPAWRYLNDRVFECSRCATTSADLPGTCWDDFDRQGGPVKVVLTVAHLDHQPENIADENLRAWCQRCHNAYDAPTRAAGIADRKHQGKAVADMFADLKLEDPRKG